jgi:pimeloyl-ACP methyl ester carboxylesterase
MHWRLLFIALLGLAGTSALWSTEPVAVGKKPVLVMVHGAWAGGWHMRKVAPLLEARGDKVYTPTLSGLGERYHTATPAIGLDVHIEDIVNFILFEDLHEVILLGHSYGGMVITGVADRIPERIARLIYLDAYLPENGESLMSLRKGGSFPIEHMTRDGFVIPTWVKPDKPFPKDVPHPLKTFTDPITLKNPAAAKIPGTYILTVEKGKAPEDDEFYPAAERAKTRGWPVIVFEADHVPYWRKPAETAELLSGIR